MIKNQSPSLQIQAYERRLKDNKGAKALCHLIPFYGLYYACSRRTITPAFLWLITNLVLVGLFFLYIYLFGMSDSEIEWAEELLYGIRIFSIPIAAQIGINKARARAITRLKQLESGEDNNVLSRNFSNLSTKLQKVRWFDRKLLNEIKISLLEFLKTLYDLLSKYSLLILNWSNQKIASSKISKKMIRVRELKLLYENGELTQEEYEELRKRELGLNK